MERAPGYGERHRRSRRAETTARSGHLDGRDGALLDTLLQHDLVDEYRLLVHPVVQGSGKRLFENANESTKMTLVDTEAVGSGVVVLTYEPAMEDDE